MSLDKLNKDIKTALWMLGFNLLITTPLAFYMTTQGNPFFFIDVICLSVAFYGLHRRIYWIAIALCVYWGFNILAMASVGNAISWIIRIWFMYQYIKVARGLGSVRNKEIAEREK